jgi:exoribonuclease R
VPSPRLSLPAADPRLEAGLAALRERLEVPTVFPPAVQEEAAAAAQHGPAPFDRADRRDIPFVTIDPPGSRDLDQAYAATRVGKGFRVFYAIADVAAWVTPGGPVDTEARARGVTLYAPDGRAALYPPVLSEGAASLLPDGDRPALLWTLDLDADGELHTTRVERALVRSREQLDYEDAQRRIDTGAADDSLARLRDIGRLRIAREADRGAVSLDLPEQEIVRADGAYSLHYRTPVAAEHWNAQVSLLTGMAAATIMLDARIGLLRTLPPPRTGTVQLLRRSANVLHIPWPGRMSYAERVRTLDPTKPAHAAFMHQAARLFRGAGYVAFDGTVPEGTRHEAIAAPYAHVTAPLRRLGDRFAAEVAVASCAGTPVPDWARAALPELPAILGRAQQRQHAVDRAAVDLVESLLFRDQVGKTFAAVVVDVDEHRAVVQLEDPAVIVDIAPDGLQLGTTVTVRVEESDPAHGTIRVSLVTG